MEIVADHWPKESPLIGPAISIHAPYGLPGLIRRHYNEMRDRPVCVSDERFLTGHQLESISDFLADQIRSVVKRPGPILLQLHRGVDVAIAMLGVLKAGCSFLPIDFGEPPARAASMVRQAQPVAMIVDKYENLDSPWDLPLLTVSETTCESDQLAPLARVAPEQPVYVMFTSGSTGEPKGVIVSSEAICNRLLWMQRRYDLGRNDKVAQKTPYTFDPSCWEIFWPLISGAQCVFAPQDAHRNPAELAHFMMTHGVTACHFVPSMLHEFLRHPQAKQISALQHVFCSGEALSALLARRTLDQWPQVALHNLYGPTEATIDVTHWDVPADLDPAGSVSIGWPVDNTILRIADETGKPVPAGDRGELWIGGTQVALGYAGRSDLTTRAFPTVSGQRWYRTGDLVRPTADGLLYLGRVDDQVKIGGVRIEPLEIEQVLAELAVTASVVPITDSSGTALVAVLAEGTTVTDEYVRECIAQRFPAAFQLAAVCRVREFPLSGNGKLNRRRLAEYVQAWWDERATRTAAEDQLAQAWSRAVGAFESLDETQGFLATGGTSLRAIQLVAEISAASGVEVPISYLLDGNISLAALRSLVTASTTEASPDQREHGAGLPDYRQSPLAPEQRRLWLLSRLYPDSPAYNVTAILRLTGDVDVAALNSALNGAVARHDILRARIVDSACDDPHICYDATAQISLTVTDTQENLTSETEDDFVYRVATRVISDQHAPMARAYLLRSTMAPQALLLLILNHLVADQHTIDKVLAEVGTDYSRIVAGDTIAPVSRIRYSDYARAAAERIGDEQGTNDLNYWKKTLNDIPPELSMPFRLARPGPRLDFKGAASTWKLHRKFAADLRVFQREQAVTTACFFLAVLGYVLKAWSGQDTIVIGLPATKRRTLAELDLAGFLIETLPIRLDFESLVMFGDLLRQVRSRYAEAIEHSRATFDVVASALDIPHHSQRSPVFQVWLNDLTDTALAPGFADLTVERLIPPAHSALFDLNLYVHSESEALTLQLVVALDQYDRSVADELLAQCVGVATQVLAHPDVALESISLITERSLPVLPRPDEVLPSAGGRDNIIAELEAVVAAKPDASALIGPGLRISYRELWQRAAYASSGMRAIGVGRGDFVVVYATRHPDLVVTLVACWLAGACAVLVDADLPRARRNRAGEVLRPRLTVALTVADRLTAANAKSIDYLVGLGAGSPTRSSKAGPPAGLSHVLFTSGTTADPVAVGVPHGPLRDFLLWYRVRFDLRSSDRFAMLAGPGHDPVLREIFGPLLVGAELYIPPRDLMPDPIRVSAWLGKTGISVLHATPPLLELLLTADEDGGCLPDSLRLLEVGGAPLTQGLARRINEVTQAEIVNAYGTTETPQIVSCYSWVPNEDRHRDDQVPVGAGCSGSQLVVVTEAGQPAGVGQRGEIVVRSRNLAEGYLPPIARSDLFKLDSVPGVRTFRTGDMGRYNLEGLIVLDGRQDRQVSIGGHRVELCEVEAAAMRHPNVRQALAEIRVGAGSNQLMLHVASVDPLTVKQLRGFLSRVLPSHAIPLSIHVVNNLGLDYRNKAKAKPGLSESPHDHLNPTIPSAGPQTFLDRIAIAAADVLGRPLDQDENFFDAGLNSLSLVQIHEACIAGSAQPFPITVLFARPNLRALARYLVDKGTPAKLDASASSNEPAVGRFTGQAHRNEADEHYR